MESFEPLINILTVLTVLSVLAERATNLLKLQSEELRVKKTNEDAERTREYGISARTIAVGILVALLVKADIFEILSRLDDPWKTLGWVQIEDYRWMRSAATTAAHRAVYAAVGCVLTGIALGFGAKFWHDVLGSVYELRDMARKRNSLAAPVQPGEAGDGNR
jgi:hypothetical protein